MFNPHGTALRHSKANGRYTMFATWEDLVRTYQGALAEFHRVLKPKGIVAFKTQDYTDARTTMTHCLVHQWAVERGFYAKDLLIRYRNHGPAYNIHLKQKHARKFNSYWFVLEKTRAV
jgi:ubiquinone/menaquinone biosynthesis C-methylase UbiE